MIKIAILSKAVKELEHKAAIRPYRIPMRIPNPNRQAATILIMYAAFTMGGTGEFSFKVPHIVAWQA